MRTVAGKPVSFWREGQTDVAAAFIQGQDATNAVADALAKEGYTVKVEAVGSRGLYSLLGEKPVEEEQSE